MSSFSITAINKKTKKIHKVWCLDDCFGHHQYGYAIDGSEPITEIEFNKNYKPHEVEK